MPKNAWRGVDPGSVYTDEDTGYRRLAAMVLVRAWSDLRSQRRDGAMRAHQDSARVFLRSEWAEALAGWAWIGSGCRGVWQTTDEGLTTLHLACGAGRITCGLERAGIATVYAFDISPVVVETPLAGLGIGQQIRWLRQKLEE